MADALLRACPGLRIMATSRHVLGVCGEVADRHTADERPGRLSACGAGGSAGV